MKITTIKAWAFLADSKDGKYFIEGTNHEDTIYFKKPKAQFSPFDYERRKPTWKPTEIEIKIKK